MKTKIITKENEKDTKNKGFVLKGIVVSDKMDKTIVVLFHALLNILNMGNFIK